MIISDRPAAERCLRRIGYYRLSAYWYPFRNILLGPVAPNAPPSSLRLDTFVDNTRYEEVFEFYVFDKQMRILVLDGLERIEIYMRAIISDLLGSRDPLGHRNPKFLDGKFSRNPNFLGNTPHQEWLKKQDKKFSTSKDEFAVHFRDKDPHSHPPIWIACEVWDWGTLSHLFSGLKPVDRDNIASKFGKFTGKELNSWMHSLNIVRNICAHHSRLWNRDLGIKPSLPNVGIYTDLDHVPRKHGTNQVVGRLYTALSIMNVMISSINSNRSSWHSRIKHLSLNGPTNRLISLHSAGFPDNWDQQNIWS